MTGLFAVDGIDLPGLIAENLGPRVLPAVLVRPGALLPRDPENPNVAPVRGAPTNHPCRGFVERFSDDDVSKGLVQVGDRKVILLAGTLAVEPLGGPDNDQVTIEGATWQVLRVMDRDPAGATWTLQVRDVPKGGA